MRILSRGMLVALSLIGAMVPTAAIAEIFPFEALGYRRSVTLRGVNPALQVSVPLPPSGISPDDSFVQLELTPSAALNPESTVRLTLNNEPVAVVTVETLRANPVVTVPLNQLPLGSPVATLGIEPYLYIQRRYCEDLPTGNLFLTVGKDSFFQITPLTSNPSLLDFFRPVYRGVILEVPQALSQEDAQAALALYSLLVNQFHDRSVPVLWQRPGQPLSLPAPPANLPAPGIARVVLNTSASGPDLDRQGDTLRVRASATVVRSLRDLTLNPALVSPSLGVEAVNGETTPVAQPLTLQRLGYDSRPRRFLGSHTIAIPFRLAQLGGRPRQLWFDLQANWTPVEPDLQERLTAQIYLNDSLIQTFDLSDRTRLRELVALPVSLLRANNDLSLLLTYVPSEGRCLTSPTELTFQLQGESGLRWGRYQPPADNFSDLPQAFQSPRGQLAVDINRPEDLAAAAYLLGAITRLSLRPLMPEVVPPGTEAQGIDWQMVVAAPDQQAWAAPVSLTAPFTIYNPKSQQPLLVVEPGSGLGILQYFRQQGTPTLWLSRWQGSDRLMQQLAAALADPQQLYGDRLQGNVATFTEATQVLSWDLSNRTLRVRYAEAFDWAFFLHRYRLPLTLGGGVLVAGLGGLIYRRLSRHQPLPIAEATAQETP